MIRRMWINQPSNLQPLYSYHGVNVLVELPAEHNGTQICAKVYFIDGNVISMEVPIHYLSEGWPNHQPRKIFIVTDDSKQSYDAGGIFSAAFTSDSRAKKYLERFDSIGRASFDVEEYILDSELSAQETFHDWA